VPVMEGAFILCLLLLTINPTVPTAVTGATKQVDTAGSWNRVEVEVEPNGTICVCYQDSTTGNLVLAEKGDTWRREALGPAYQKLDRLLVSGPGGRPAVLLNNTPITYQVETDTGWARTFCRGQEALCTWPSTLSATHPCSGLSGTTMGHVWQALLNKTRYGSRIHSGGRETRTSTRRHVTWEAFTVMLWTGRITSARS